MQQYTLWAVFNGSERSILFSFFLILDHMPTMKEFLCCCFSIMLPQHVTANRLNLSQQLQCFSVPILSFQSLSLLISTHPSSDSINTSPSIISFMLRNYLSNIHQGMEKHLTSQDALQFVGLCHSEILLSLCFVQARGRETISCEFISILPPCLSPLSCLGLIF